MYDCCHEHFVLFLSKERVDFLQLMMNAHKEDDDDDNKEEGTQVQGTKQRTMFVCLSFTWGVTQQFCTVGTCCIRLNCKV